MLPILCTQKLSNYRHLVQEYNLDLYDIKRDAYTYTGSDMLIAHPPCQQWCKLKHFSKKDNREKELAVYCYELVNKNGGILEHPLGSSLFKTLSIPSKNTFLIHQSDFGFPAQKPTLLFVKDCELLPIYIKKPINLVNLKSVNELSQEMRSRMTLDFCKYLINTLKNTNK